MSVVLRFPPSNVSKQQYDSLKSELEGAGEWPAEGCQLHVCFGPEDNIRISEVWESPEEAQAFGEKLGARMEKAGIKVPGPEVFEVLVYETY